MFHLAQLRVNMHMYIFTPLRSFSLLIQCNAMKVVVMTQAVFFSIRGRQRLNSNNLFPFTSEILHCLFVTLTLWFSCNPPPPSSILPFQETKPKIGERSNMNHEGGKQTAGRRAAWWWWWGGVRLCSRPKHANGERRS